MYNFLDHSSSLTYLFKFVVVNFYDHWSHNCAVATVFFLFDTSAAGKTGCCGIQGLPVEMYSMCFCGITFPIPFMLSVVSAKLPILIPCLNFCLNSICM